MPHLLRLPHPSLRSLSGSRHLAPWAGTVSRRRHDSSSSDSAALPRSSPITASTAAEGVVDAAASVEDAGKETPLAHFGIFKSTSPAFVESNRSLIPLRWVVRVAVRSKRSAPTRAVASASIKARTRRPVGRHRCPCRHGSHRGVRSGQHWRWSPGDPPWLSLLFNRRSPGPLRVASRLLHHLEGHQPFRVRCTETSSQATDANPPLIGCMRRGILRTRAYAGWIRPRGKLSRNLWVTVRPERKLLVTAPCFPMKTRPTSGSGGGGGI